MRPKFYREKQEDGGAIEEKRAKMGEGSSEDNGPVKKKVKVVEETDNNKMDERGEEASKLMVFKKKRDFILDLRKKRVDGLGDEGRSKEVLSSSSSPQSFSSSPQTVDGKSSPELEEESGSGDQSSRSQSPAAVEVASCSSHNEAEVIPSKEPSAMTSPQQQPPVIPTAVHPWGIPPGPGPYGQPLPRPPHMAVPYQSSSGKGIAVYPGLPHLPFPPPGMPVLPPGQHPARLLLDFSARAHAMGATVGATGLPGRCPPVSHPESLKSPEPSTSSGLTSRSRTPESGSEPSSPVASTSTSPADGGKPGSAKKDKDKGRNPQPYTQHQWWIKALIKRAAGVVKMMNLSKNAFTASFFPEQI